MVKTVGMVWVLGGLWEGVRDEMGELPMGRCSLLVGLRSSSQSLDKLAHLDFNFFTV